MTKKNTFTIIFSVVIFLFSVLTAIYAFVASGQLWLTHTTSCPNLDVLSWDANLRLIGVMDQLVAFHRGDWWEGIKPFIDAPTWPPLRPFIAMVVHLLRGGVPNTVADSFISLFFFIALIVAMFPFAITVTGERNRGLVLWIFSTLGVLNMHELFAYTFSSMLETQGMFFLMIETYVLYQFYAEIYRIQGRVLPEQFQSLEDNNERIRYVFEPSRGVKVAMIFSGLGLYFTKYPYGLMMILSILGYEVATNFKQYIHFGQSLFRGRYFRWRLAPAVLLILIYLLNYINVKFQLHLHEKLTPRSIKNLFFITLIYYFFDFSYYLFKNATFAGERIPRAFSSLFRYSIFPSLFWQFIHPDRMMSALGSQQHSQDAERHYIVSFFSTVFNPSWIAYIIAGLFFLFVVYALFLIVLRKSDPTGYLAQTSFGRIVMDHERWKQEEAGNGNRFQFSLLRLKYDPVVAVLFITLLQYAIMEFLTGNKQLRHIYHMIPAFVLLSGAVFLRFGNYRNTGKIPLIKSLFLHNLTPFLLLLAGVSIFYARPFWNREPRELCFTGTNSDLFRAPRELARVLEKHHDYILINTFHNVYSTASGRFIATDFDLLFRKSVWGSGSVINDDEYKVKSWNTFDRLLVIQENCSSQNYMNYLKPRLQSMHSTLNDEKRYESSDRVACLLQYKLTPVVQ